MPPDSPNPSPTQEVERWRLSDIGPQMVNHPAGDFVSFEDHQQLLQAEVEKREEVEGERDDFERRYDRSVQATQLAQIDQEAAESKLSSAVEELEAQKDAAERIEGEAQTDYSRVFWAGIVSATDALLLLLRDKGTEATCTHLKDLQVEGTEQGGTDG